MSKEQLIKEFPKSEIRPLVELFEGELHISAANGNIMEFVGWVPLVLKLGSEELVVPFLITEICHIEIPIIGFNVI